MIQKKPFYHHQNHHTFQGVLEVEVRREIETFIDSLDDNSFQSTEIVSTDLEEIDFESWGEREGDNY